MSSTAAACLVVAALTSLAGKPDVVAVSPCIVGPGVGQELGAAVTEMVVTSIMGLPGVAVLDRSLTKAVVREQDLTLVSRAAAVLPQRFGDLGAEQVLAVGLLETSSGFVLSLRLIDVATGEVLKSAVHQVRSRTKLLAECGDYARALWDQAGDGSASAGAPLAVDAALEDMWRRLDHGQVRQLLGPHLDRAESVYRQYVRAVQTGSADQAEHLAHMASIYLTDCLSWLQRALDPPVGMVYVPPGWVTLSVPGTRTRRFWVGAFFMDRCAYTREEYLRFLEASSRAKPLGWTDPSEQTADLPVVGLDWHDAEAAAEWRGMQLPTYPQWLRAVQGEHPRKYPWGDVWRAERCNFARDPLRMALEPVGSHPDNASEFGVLDGVGSVFEWLDTWYSSSYWDDAPARNPPGPAEGSAKLAVGGSFRSAPQGCTCSSVQQLGPETRKDDLGFRCVLPLRAGTGKRGAP